MRLRSLRRGRLRRRLGYWENLDTADFLADVAHGKRVGMGVEIGACSAVATERSPPWDGVARQRHAGMVRHLVRTVASNHLMSAA